MEDLKMFKMKAYKKDFLTSEIEFLQEVKSNSLEYFESSKNRKNYVIEIFQKIKNKWVLIYSEL